MMLQTPDEEEREVREVGWIANSATPVCLVRMFPCRAARGR